MTGHPAPLYGLVLAGGAGTRMGRAKAGLELGGVSLVTRAAESLAVVCARVFVSVRPEVRRYLPAGSPPVLEDTAPDLGPIAGVLAAFEHAAAAGWLVLAADMPWVGSQMLRALAAGRGPGWDAVAFGGGGPGGVEPLCAVYEPAAGAAIARAAAVGERSLRRLLASVCTRVLEAADPAALASLNTPEDLARAAARLAARP